MVSLACTTTQQQGITLVTGRIENPDRPRRVCVENRLDGPVWPPRRRGVPAAGWTAEGFECVLAAGETRAVGYASPAPPTDPPLAVAETEPVDAEAGDAAFEPRTAVPSVENTPAGVVRALGSPRPPRDAVPVPDADSEGADAGGTAETAATVDGDADPQTLTAGDGTGSPPTLDAVAGPESVATGPSTGTTERPADSPSEVVDDWFGAVEARLELADELSGTTRLPAVADALERAGGLDGLRDAAERLDADADELRRVAERATALAERAETATVPVEPIERLR